MGILNHINAIRDKFMWIDSCPFSGPRIFLENAGGSLTLKSVVETSTRFASLPDNAGRPNVASRQMERTIAEGKSAIRDFFNVDKGIVFLGETGTELIFRIIGAAAAANQQALQIVGSTLEHPSTRSASSHWTQTLGGKYRRVLHDIGEGTVNADAYAGAVNADTRIVTIVHTSPVTGKTVDLESITASIRTVSPNCLIVVDGIQHAAHGPVDLSKLDIDAYVISPYKVFSRHGYGIAWISDRFSSVPHSRLAGSDYRQWELGTRDAGAYATFSQVVAYLDWLGGTQADEIERRARLKVARSAIKAYEDILVDHILNGGDGVKGVAAIDGVTIVGGEGSGLREGLVSFAIEGRDSLDIVEQLEARHIRIHLRKNDYYSGNILEPMGLPSCLRVSVSHYNTVGEIHEFLCALQEVIRT